MAISIKKAIEILSEHAYGRSATFNEDHYDAVKLLIEAGKRIEATRLVRKVGTVVLLPGETED